MMKNMIKDKNGLLYSSELLLAIIVLVFIIGAIANLSDDLNEKALSEEEFSSLEKMAMSTSDYLLNNPGNPEDWERDESLNGIASSKIIPGLAVKRKNADDGEFYSESASDEMIMSNSISYHKLMRLRNNYELLVDENLLNDSYKSSMAIYPLNSKIRPLVIGDDFDDNVNDINIAVVNRTVKCDFHSNLVVYNFNDLELSGDGLYEDGICNHDTNPNLENHSYDGRSLWLCKSFRVYKKSLEEYEYYLISDESIKNSKSYWILESLNRTDDNKKRLNQEIIDLNPFFNNDLENSSGEIYSIHFNVPKDNEGDFKTVLVAIPKNMTNDLISNDEMKYDYFKVQDVDFVMKMSYK